MVIVVLIVAGLLGWGSATLLLNGWWRRWERPDLAERLGLFAPTSLGDEAQRWLDEQS